MNGSYWESLPQNAMGYVGLKVVVENPNTANAEVVNSILSGPDFTALKDSTGEYLRGIEPSATIDGRMFVYQSRSPSPSGRIFYTYNATPENLDSLWISGKSITDLYNDRKVILAGQSIEARYPLSRQPLRSNSGEPFKDGIVRGAYPWLSSDGTELFYQGSTAFFNRTPNDSSTSSLIQRAGASVIGRWTGYKLRHIDSFLNSDVSGTQRRRIFNVGIASTSSIWSPFTSLRDSKFPSILDRPAYLTATSYLDNSNIHGIFFSELGFRDFVDGRYILSMEMNPLLNQANNYVDFSRTPDLSANDFVGSLKNGAEFPIYDTDVYNPPFTSGKPIKDTLELIGIKGQAIRFPKSGFVEIVNKPILNEIQDGYTIEMHYRLLKEPTPSPSNRLQLIKKEGVFTLSVDDRHKLYATVFIGGVAYDLDFQAPNRGPQQFFDWVHIALTHDPKSGTLGLYQNGVLVAKRTVALGLMDATTNNILLGPANVGNWSATGNLCVIDEVKISNIVRSSTEIADSAFIPTSQRKLFLETISLPDIYRKLPFRAPSELAINTKKAQLGYALFNDPRLSSNNKISCATCHMSSSGFADNLKTSVGVSGKPLKRNTPAIINRGFSNQQMLDGRFNSLFHQASGPITNADEMGMNSMESLFDKLKLIKPYASAFYDVYKESPTSDNIANALASFQTIMLAQESPADRYESTGQGLTDAEVEGRKLFFGKANCIGCHSGINWTDELYDNKGLVPGNADLGRFVFSNNSNDKKAFKTPTLRNISLTAPYMHGGEIATLEAVIALYNAGGLADSIKSPEMRPLNLTGQEQAHLVAYLKSMTSPILPILPLNLKLKNIEAAYPHQCNGPVFANAIVCPNDEFELTKSESYQLAPLCTQTQKCEMICKSGFILNKGSCVAKSDFIDNSAFVSQLGVPTVMAPGSTSIVRIKMKNTGTTTWSSATLHRLGVLGDKAAVWGFGRVNLESNEMIEPGQFKTFTFTIKAPMVAGTYEFNWKMVREGIAWFGQSNVTNSIQVGVVPVSCLGTPPIYSAYCPGDQTGLTQGLALQLAASCTDQRKCELVCDSGYRWDVGQCLPVKDVIDNAEFVSQSGIPSTMVAGSKAQIEILLKNVGTSTWTSESFHRLGSQSPQDNQTWGMGRVELNPLESVDPGQIKKFSIVITAPRAPGIYNLSWEMVRERIGWFGSSTPLMKVTVKPASP